MSKHTKSPESMSNVANSIDDTTVKLVLFDMDGTLLDLAFDNYIWMQLVPKIWAKQHNYSLDIAKAELYQFYLDHQGSLDWYSSQFWQDKLGIDVWSLQYQHRHLIQARAYCFELLQQLEQHDIECWLITNADIRTLQLKLETIPLSPYFKQIVSSEALGYAKEQQEFWQQLQNRYYFNPQTTMFIDDNYQVLDSAKQFGITHLCSITEPDSKHLRQTQNTDYIHLQQLTDLLDLLALGKDSQIA